MAVVGQEFVRLSPGQDRLVAEVPDEWAKAPNRGTLNRRGRGMENLTRCYCRHIFVQANMKTTTLVPVDAVFRACSDRTRLRILNLLRDGELCVCHIVDVLEVPQPTASRHLAYLRRARLVTARKEGLWSYYRLTPARSKFHQALLDCLTSIREVPEFLADAREVAALRKRCC